VITAEGVVVINFVTANHCFLLCHNCVLLSVHVTDRSELLSTIPVLYLILHLNPPLGSQPSLMTLEQVRSLFYEVSAPCFMDLYSTLVDKIFCLIYLF